MVGEGQAIGRIGCPALEMIPVPREASCERRYAVLVWRIFRSPPGIVVAEIPVRTDARRHKMAELDRDIIMFCIEYPPNSTIRREAVLWDHIRSV